MDTGKRKQKKPKKYTVNITLTGTLSKFTAEVFFVAVEQLAQKWGVQIGGGIAEVKDGQKD